MWKEYESMVYHGAGCCLCVGCLGGTLRGSSYDLGGSSALNLEVLVGADVLDALVVVMARTISFLNWEHSLLVSLKAL